MSYIRSSNGGSSEEVNIIQSISDVFSDFKTVTDSFTAVVGKHYIVTYTRGNNSTHGVKSGGTVLTSITPSGGTSKSYYLCLVRATSTTISMEGSGNTIWYSQID